MIEIRILKEQDLKCLNEFFVKNNLNLDIKPYITNSMAAFEQGNILGFTGYIQNGYLALISFIFVDKNRRREYIGEGLIKGLLSIANNRGIRKVVTNCNNDFIVKLGFDLVSTTIAREYSNIFNKKIKLEDSIYEVTLPDYFLKGCKNSKNQ